MEARGRVEQIYKSYDTGRYSVTFEMAECDIDRVEELRGKDLRITAEKYREPRSTAANKLLWHCIGQFVQAFGGSKDEYYLDALKKYGKYTMVAVPENLKDAFISEWKLCEEVGRHFDGDVTMVHLLCFFGSHTYNSKEFNTLLSGVINDMKEVGLDAPPTSEMRRVIEAWKEVTEE